jgi:hypothetical protein
MTGGHVDLVDCLGGGHLVPQQVWRNSRGDGSFVSAHVPWLYNEYAGDVTQQYDECL